MSFFFLSKIKIAPPHKFLLRGCGKNSGAHCGVVDGKIECTLFTAESAGGKTSDGNTLHNIAKTRGRILYPPLTPPPPLLLAFKMSRFIPLQFFSTFTTTNSYSEMTCNPFFFWNKKCGWNVQRLKSYVKSLTQFSFAQFSASLSLFPSIVKALWPEAYVTQLAEHKVQSHRKFAKGEKRFHFPFLPTLYFENIFGDFPPRHPQLLPRLQIELNDPLRLCSLKNKSFFKKNKRGEISLSASF